MSKNRIADLIGKTITDMYYDLDGYLVIEFDGKPGMVISNIPAGRIPEGRYQQHFVYDPAGEHFDLHSITPAQIRTKNIKVLK